MRGKVSNIICSSHFWRAPFVSSELEVVFWTHCDGTAICIMVDEAVVGTLIHISWCSLV